MIKRIFKSTFCVSIVTMLVVYTIIVGILYDYFQHQIKAELKAEAEYVAAGIEAVGKEYLTDFENDKGEEIVAVWGWLGGQFTYESDKPYFEVYDMYGNKTVVNNTDGSYKVNFGEAEFEAFFKSFLRPQMVELLF